MTTHDEYQERREAWKRDIHALTPWKRAAGIQTLIEKQRELGSKIERAVAMETDRLLFAMEPVDWVEWAIEQGLTKVLQDIFDWAANPHRAPMESHHGAYYNLGPAFPSRYGDHHFHLAFHDQRGADGCFLLAGVPEVGSMFGHLNALFWWREDEWLRMLDLVESNWGTVSDHWNGPRSNSGSMEIVPFQKIPTRSDRATRMPLPKGWGG